MEHIQEEAEPLPRRSSRKGVMALVAFTTVLTLIAVFFGG